MQEAISNLELAKTQARKVVSDIANLVCYHKKSIQLTETSGSTFATLTLDVHDQDYGFMVGSLGAVVRAIASVCDLIGESHGVMIRFGIPRHEHPAQPHPKRPRSCVMELESLREIAENIALAVFQFASTTTIEGDSTFVLITITRHSAEPSRGRSRELEDHCNVVFNAIAKSLCVNEIRVRIISE